jgi:hypothetical protein
MNPMPDLPNGPLPDDHVSMHKTLAPNSLAGKVDSIAAALLSSSPPLPDMPLFKQHEAALSKLQKEVWFCHWGMVVSLSVYQQLLSQVQVGIRESIAQTLGTSLAAMSEMDETQAHDLIKTEFDKIGLSALKPDMQQIRKWLDCTVLQSTVICYIRDITLNLHYARLGGSGRDSYEEQEALYPTAHTLVCRNFFLRFAAVGSALLDILYEVMPLLSGPA